MDKVNEGTHDRKHIKMTARIGNIFSRPSGSSFFKDAKWSEISEFSQFQQLINRELTRGEQKAFTVQLRLELRVSSKKKMESFLTVL